MPNIIVKDGILLPPEKLGHLSSGVAKCSIDSIQELRIRGNFWLSCAIPTYRTDAGLYYDQGHLVCILPVAAPEIIRYIDQWFILFG